MMMIVRYFLGAGGGRGLAGDTWQSNQSTPVQTGSDAAVCLPTEEASVVCCSGVSVCSEIFLETA